MGVYQNNGSFKIEDSVFSFPSTSGDCFLVPSLLGDYHLRFEAYKPQFSSSDVLLIDKKVRELYQIDHEKIIEIEAKEENKSIETVLEVTKKLMSFGFTKNDRLVVMGGGILQEIGSFTAKIFKRGARWKFYPTTLLSQADSCIGGKSGLNFGGFKNQLGVFSTPEEVVIDSRFLETLPPREITAGMGEVIKIFLIGGESYLGKLEEWSLAEKVKNAILLKRAIVIHDEFEDCERKALNLGHSFGHVIEALTHYEISHGEAVLLGTLLINQIFEQNIMVLKLLEKYTSLKKIRSLCPQELTWGLLSDKKVAGNTISLVRLASPGETFFASTPVDEALQLKVKAALLSS